MQTINDIDFEEKRVFCRVDFNVPLDDKQQISDDTRIRAALPTLNHIREKKGKLIVASHLGRPKGKVVAAMSLAPVAKRLGEMMQTEVKLVPDVVGAEVEKAVSQMRAGDVLLLENLRFHSGEEANDPEFSKALAALCDVYVNDAFAVCHRKNASVVGITRYVPQSAAGFLLEKELQYFEKAMADPQRPLVAMVGGAKISGKLKAVENLLEKVDKMMIGGAMAHTFLKGMGLEVGRSLLEADLVPTAQTIMQRAAEKKVRFYLPVDVVLAREFDAGADVQNRPVQEILPDWMALDIGPATGILYAEALSDAGTVIWNGPMGAFEMAPFSKGTLALVDAVAHSRALTIIGGGDTISAVNMAGKADAVGYISTGGGAFLKLLEGEPLPAVAALSDRA